MDVAQYRRPMRPYPMELQMPAPAVFVFVLALAVPTDTGLRAANDSTVGATQGPALSSLATGVRMTDDTVRRRAKAVEVGDWYERRLRIHRYGSYTIYPLFALQTIAGNQLYGDSRNGPMWAKNSMRYGATALAGVFTSNTVTGLWNLWDSRSVPQGRTRRTVHALLMLASDAGFSYAGSTLAKQAETSESKRHDHKVWAYGSMATALTGAGLMTLWRDDR